MNYYVITLILLLLAGLGLSFWGLQTRKAGKQRSQWPTTPGRITESKECSQENDLLPTIRYLYTVEQTTHAGQLMFAGGTQPMPGFARHYVERYPEGKEVAVYYNPDAHNESTIEPQGAQDGWLILAAGVLTTLFSVIALLTGLL